MKPKKIHHTCGGDRSSGLSRAECEACHHKIPVDRPRNIIRTEEVEMASVEGNPDYHRIIPKDRVLNGVEEVRQLLAQITFAPSCVDMGWGWQVEAVFVHDGFRSQTDRHGTMMSVSAAGYRLRTTFQRPDRKTGNIETGFGRWWEIPNDPTISGVVKTAFAAAKMILEHELMESFKWQNTRVFDPHNTVQELAAISGGRYTMSIP